MSISAVRAIVQGLTEAEKRLLQVELLQGEYRDKLEHYEPYGFTSTPMCDGEVEAIPIFFDEDRSHGVVVCATDRRYRPKDLKHGEVCIFDNLGRKIFLSKGGIKIEGVSSNITINTSASVQVNASSDITIQSNLVKIQAPTTQITGNVAITGTLIANNGTMNVSGNELSMTGSINVTDDVTAGNISLTSHTHSGVEAGGSSTGGPQ